MKHAVIDIGTNTILMLIAEVKDSSIYPDTLFDIQQIPRLGKGVDKNKSISEQSIEKAIRILNDYKKLLTDNNVKDISLTATSCIRDAGNKYEFIDRIKESTGFDIEILSGKDEARWTLTGGIYDKLAQADGDKITLIDIGGGSTEVSLMDKDYGNEVFDIINNFQAETCSVDVGSVRIKEKFFKNDDVTESIKNAEDFINNEFEKLICFELQNSFLIGVAGTITTLAAYHLKLNEFLAEKVDGMILTYKNIEALTSEIFNSSNEELLESGNYMHGRADIIGPGILILKVFMKKYHFDKILVSTKGLRYGILLRNLYHKKYQKSSRSGS